MLKKVSSKLWIILLYAAYHLNMMSCSIYTDSRTGWVWASYRTKLFAMILGFLSFSISRRIVKDHVLRKRFLMLINIVYSISLIIIMLSNDPGIITMLSLLAMFLVGHMGGVVYYYVSLGIYKFEHAGLVVALATSLAYITHYICWAVLGQEIIMVIVMLAGFGMVSYIVIDPKSEYIYMDPLPYSDGSDVKDIKMERKHMLLLIGVAAVALLSVDRSYQAFVDNYSDLAGEVYGLSRLTALPASFLIGFLYDRKRRDIMSILMLLAMIIRIWLPADFFLEGLLIFTYQISEVYIYLFITISFWEAAPESGHQELWASFGRVLMIMGFLMDLLGGLMPKGSSIGGQLLDCVLFLLAIGFIIMELSYRQARILEQKIKEASAEGKEERHLVDLTEKYGLTPREKDVVAELLSNPDLQVQALADHLGISRTMFYRYMNKLYEKTGTLDRIQLVSKLNDQAPVS